MKIRNFRRTIRVNKRIKAEKRNKKQGKGISKVETGNDKS
jgi:hypothetical protein